MKETAQQLVADFLKDRPVMEENNTFHEVVKLLLGEVDELKEAHLNGDNKDIAQEVADVFIFAYTLANILGVDVDEEVREKVAYNMTRYIAGNFQDGTYEEGREKSRNWVRDTDWKKQFYEDTQISPVTGSTTG
ncbi:MAG: hypothetical protein IFNCLDLE_02622 [Ignavibacteriaceae bacterium]|nr:hypothetical protein [Ignavibacteriaceae bacterium]